jgi:hypothetical protein
MLEVMGVLTFPSDFFWQADGNVVPAGYRLIMQAILYQKKMVNKMT